MLRTSDATRTSDPENPQNCLTCRKVVSSSGAVVNHFCRFHSPRVTLVFADRSSLVLRRRKDRLFRCPCGYSKKSAETMIRHAKVHLSLSAIDTSQNDDEPNEPNGSPSVAGASPALARNMVRPSATSASAMRRYQSPTAASSAARRMRSLGSSRLSSTTSTLISSNRASTSKSTPLSDTSPSSSGLETPPFLRRSLPQKPVKQPILTNSSTTSRPDIIDLTATSEPDEPIYIGSDDECFIIPSSTMSRRKKRKVTEDDAANKHVDSTTASSASTRPAVDAEDDSSNAPMTAYYAFPDTPRSPPLSSKPVSKEQYPRECPPKPPPDSGPLDLEPYHHPSCPRASTSTSASNPISPFTARKRKRTPSTSSEPEAPLEPFPPLPVPPPSFWKQREIEIERFWAWRSEAAKLHLEQLRAGMFDHERRAHSEMFWGTSEIRSFASVADNSSYAKGTSKNLEKASTSPAQIGAQKVDESHETQDTPQKPVDEDGDDVDDPPRFLSPTPPPDLSKHPRPVPPPSSPDTFRDSSTLPPSPSLGAIPAPSSNSDESLPVTDQEVASATEPQPSNSALDDVTTHNVVDDELPIANPSKSDDPPQVSSSPPHPTSNSTASYADMLTAYDLLGTILTSQSKNANPAFTEPIIQGLMPVLDYWTGKFADKIARKKEKATRRRVDSQPGTSSSVAEATDTIAVPS
ncbi:hypothetical protein SISNIDRAFT_548892 [Sistotremastrum niveocremeum HHB9708]|uniref:Uncharacterized protein n=1 Tax=Sistotremastrum niveocremeum HHB9708 TaxID=1314777 RepID=A0A164WFQ3_9AGAM|nr:hypothetical protein SISNIDRAFT_548892 [Sistotremastrum niveocremeum HHB9708]